MSLPLIRPLDALSSADEAVFGGKSASLGELLAAGIPVPPGFALSTAAFARFVSEGALDPVIDEAMAGAGAGAGDAAAVGRDAVAVGRAAEEIAASMRAVAVPADVDEAISRAYASLPGPAPAVAVRSSAVGEDSAEATFAGQQETYLWVRGVDAVREAVRDCWASLYSAPAISYRARLGDRGRPAMGVTVQQMVDAEVSGVMFTCNPVSGDPSMVAVNASWGLGLSVVGGEVTPDDYLVSKVTREVVREDISAKTLQYVPRAEGGGTERVDVAAERREVACLDVSALERLVEVARRVERHFGRHQDIEWAIDRGGELYVVQSRPVTAAAKPKPKMQPGSALSMVMGTFGAGGRDRGA
jgi:pyruvate,water dikinase